MSSTQINVFYELQVADGKADELREIAAQMVTFNRQGEPGTLVYNIYLSEDQKLLTYWETHADSEAMLFHAERFATGEFISEVVSRTEGARLCLYGEVSSELRQWATDNGFEIEYANYLAGFVR
jgi:quinol monooxygenase YgiN